MARVLVAGGGPAGIAAAGAAARTGARVTLAEAGDRLSPDGSIFPRGLSPRGRHPDPARELEVTDGIEVRLGEPLLSVEPVAGRALTRAGRIEFERVVLATGSSPLPVDLKGVSKPGVFVIRSSADSVALSAALGSCSSAVIAGALPFSLLLAQEVSRRCAVTVLLGDRALSSFAASALLAVAVAAGERGVKLLREPADAIAGLGRAEAVISGGRVHPCDLVVVLPPRGPRLPPIECSRGSHGGALVDGAMRTSLRGVYAAGDCAEMRLGSGSLPTRLGSTSAVMGDVAGTNAAGGTAVASFSRCLAVELFGVGVCAAGVDAEQARSLGLDAISFESGNAEGGLDVSLTYDRVTGRLYGAQAAGGGADRLSGFLSLAVSTGCTLEELSRLELPSPPSSACDPSPIRLTAGRALARARGRETGEPQGPDLRHR